MERESFEDETTARLLNEHFIPIKIDREERPDMDGYYMKSLQIQGINGGWPLNAFALPDGSPFWGGTYFPPTQKMGMPSFKEILNLVVNSWQHKRAKVIEQARLIAKELAKTATSKQSGENLADALFNIKSEYFLEDKNFKDVHLKYYDEKQGGFKFQKQNKFANFLNLIHLLKIAHHEGDESLMNKVVFTTMRISHGGIYDHVGGGIARYSTDYEWKVPHFEKMLYDNALYLILLKDLFLITKEPFYQERAYHVVSYLERDLTNEGGVFYSAEDADSEGVEGKFYSWEYDELKEVLPEEKHADFYRFYEITKRGNFEGKIVLHARQSWQSYARANGRDYEKFKQAMTASLHCLMLVRQKRVRPTTDTKVILAWNALTIAAYAALGRAFGDARLIKRAEVAMEFILTHFKRNEQGAFYRRWIDGEAKHWAYLEDYALLGLASLELYESTFKEKYLTLGYEMVNYLLRFFYQDKTFYRNQIDQRDILLLDQESYDGVEPSGHSSLVLLLLKCFYYSKNRKWEDLALSIIGDFYPKVDNISLPFMLSALHDYKRGFKQIVAPNEKTLSKKKFAFINQSYLPERVSLFSKTANEGELTICRKNQCFLPTSTPDELRKYLEI